jgi:hypothetical protein
LLHFGIHRHNALLHVAALLVTLGDGGCVAFVELAMERRGESELGHDAALALEHAGLLAGGRGPADSEEGVVMGGVELIEAEKLVANHEMTGAVAPADDFGVRLGLASDWVGAPADDSFGVEGRLRMEARFVELRWLKRNDVGSAQKLRGSASANSVHGGYFQAEARGRPLVSIVMLALLRLGDSVSARFAHAFGLLWSLAIVSTALLLLALTLQPKLPQIGHSSNCSS